MTDCLCPLTGTSDAAIVTAVEQHVVANGGVVAQHLRYQWDRPIRSTLTLYQDVNQSIGDLKRRGLWDSRVKRRFVEGPRCLVSTS